MVRHPIHHDFRCKRTPSGARYAHGDACNALGSAEDDAVLYDFTADGPCGEQAETAQG